MALTTFSGPVKSNNGFITSSASVILLEDTALTVADHAGKNILIFDVNCLITLPSIVNDTIGTQFTIISLTTPSGAFVRIHTDGTDKYIGAIQTLEPGTSSGKPFLAAAVNDIITLNGTTTGGLTGSIIRFMAISTNSYYVEGNSFGTGSNATPFSGN
jgi:hypothetical protein